MVQVIHIIVSGAQAHNSFLSTLVQIILTGIGFGLVAVELRQIHRRTYYRRWITLTLALVVLVPSLFNDFSMLNSLQIGLSLTLLYYLVKRTFRCHLNTIYLEDKIVMQQSTSADIQTSLRKRPKVIFYYCLINLLICLADCLSKFYLGGADLLRNPVTELTLYLAFCMFLPPLLMILIYRASTFASFLVVDLARFGAVAAIIFMAAKPALFDAPLIIKMLISFGFLLPAFIIPELIFKRMEVRQWFKDCMLARQGKIQSV